MQNFIIIDCICFINSLFMLTLWEGGLDCTALTNRNIFSVQPIHSMIEETKFVLVLEYA